MPINKPKILIVDDDPDCRSTLSLFFVGKGFSTQEAENGKRGLELLKTFKPDVALVDRMMPGMSGTQMIEDAKKDPELANIQMVILSALSSPEEIEMGFKSGAVDYITKPFVSAEVIARTRSAIRKKSMVDEKMKQKRLEIFHKDVIKIARELQLPMGQMTKTLGSLKSEMQDEGSIEYQRVMASFDNSIRMQVIMRELQKIEDLDVDELKL